jgi:protein-tyrosine phosphatase
MVEAPSRFDPLLTHFPFENPTRRRVTLGLLLLPATARAAERRKQFIDVSCVRGADDMVSVEWVLEPANGPVTVGLSDAPIGPFRPLVAVSLGRSWQGRLAKSPRPYFELRRPGGPAIETAERFLPLEGGRNFRDMGGYEAESGRRVRWGAVYRSGTMGNLTPDDFAYLNALGIGVVCDLRSTPERSAEPVHWSGSAPPEYIVRDYEMDNSFVRDAAMGPNPTAATMKAAMVKLYENMPYDFIDSYRRLFSELQVARAPVAFNCSAGKDRSGVAAALLLLTLGVPQAQVMADYELSNRAPPPTATRRPAAAPGVPSVFGYLQRVPPSALAILGRSDPDYLIGALNAIKRRDGSVPRYMQTRLGVGPAEALRLRARILQNA